MDEFRELYQEIIMDHNKYPKNFREISECSKKVVGKNPMCGDNFTIYVKVEAEKIVDCAFQGCGCAISKASASMMTEALQGKTTQEAEAMFKLFTGMFKGETQASDHLDDLGKLAAFSGLSQFPVRVKCATLAWNALHEAVTSNQQEVTTE
jgi:nitrogen fixation NifU-like protein